MGERVETLEDLLRPGLRAVCVGINPAPTSVAAGHYYEGHAGRRIFSRLRRAGLLSDRQIEGYQDDAAFEEGIGFTDVVKRPTSNARHLRREEFDYGRRLLAERLAECKPGLVIVTFREAAERLFGTGFVPGVRLAAAEVFVMPRLFESAAIAATALDELSARLK